ncbi:MAG TPA: hypothetical protein VFY45_19560 [Baekduia sp.]|nr:hypothetical protein [Baekduia sp.]
MTRTLPIPAIAAVLALAGCQDPYADDQARPAPATTQHVAKTPSDTARPGPSAAPPPAAAPQLGASPRQVARTFATRWANWDWRTASRQQRALARLAVGGLAQQLIADASSARIDATLGRDKPGARGTVAAIDLDVRATRATGIAVTHEQTYTDGRADLGGQRYRVYLIRLTKHRGNWGVSAWEPQP